MHLEFVYLTTSFRMFNGHFLRVDKRREYSSDLLVPDWENIFLGMGTSALTAIISNRYDDKLG